MKKCVKSKDTVYSEEMKKTKKKCVKSKDAVNLHLVATEPSAANGSLRVLLAGEHDDDHLIEDVTL